MSSYDTSEPKIFPILMSYLISIVLLTIIIVWSIFYYRSVTSQELVKKERQFTSDTLIQTRLYETKELTTLTWKNKPKRIIKVPIELAMKLVEKDYR